jgi:hypothetical protein
MKKSKYPKFRTYVKKGANGQRWVSYGYDMRGTGKPDVSLGSDYSRALDQWNKLHNHMPLTLGRIQEAINLWREVELPKYESQETRKGYTKNLKTIEAWCGGMTWAEVTLPMLRQYLRKRSAKVQGNREMSILQIIWNYALMDGITVEPWPAAGVKGWKNEEYAREFEVTDALFNAVYEFADQVLRDCMDISTTTGMRLTDARTVRMPIDGKLRFKSSKKGKHSYFEVNESPVLTALLARRGTVDCVTLLTTDTGRTVSYSMLRTRYDTARMLAAEAYPALADQIEKMFLRDTRKRAADLADNMQEASELLQHDSIKTTEDHYRTKATKLKAVR